MITKVLNDKGEVLHDCGEASCDVSWDGYAIKGGLKISGQVNALGIPIADITIAKNDRVPNGQDPDEAVWTVSGATARLKRNANG